MRASIAAQRRAANAECYTPASVSRPSPSEDDEDDERAEAEAIEAAATIREASIDELRVREIACTDVVRELLGDALLDDAASSVFVVALPIGNIVCRSWEQALDLAASWGDPGDDDDDDDD